MVALAAVSLELKKSPMCSRKVPYVPYIYLVGLADLDDSKFSGRRWSVLSQQASVLASHCRSHPQCRKGVGLGWTVEAQILALLPSERTGLHVPLDTGIS